MIDARLHIFINDVHLQKELSGKNVKFKIDRKGRFNVSLKDITVRVNKTMIVKEFFVILELDGALFKINIGDPPKNLYRFADITING